jgi:hypothetical protein
VPLVLFERDGISIALRDQEMPEVDLDMRGNAHLDTALKRYNVNSLHELIEKDSSGIEPV